MSLTKPVKKMPAASMWTVLAESTVGLVQEGQGVYVRATNVGISTPVQDGQEDHVKSVGAQVSCHGEVGVEGGRAQLLLHEGEVGRLPAHDGDEEVAHGVAPWRQSSSVCTRTLAGVGMWVVVEGGFWAHSGPGACCPRRASAPLLLLLQALGQRQRRAHGGNSWRLLDGGRGVFAGGAGMGMGIGLAAGVIEMAGPVGVGVAVSVAWKRPPIALFAAPLLCRRSNINTALNNPSPLVPTTEQLQAQSVY